MKQAVDRLAQRVKRLGRLAVEMQELAVDLGDELAIIRRTLAADASGRLSAAVECGLLRAEQARNVEVMRSAAVGARTFELKPLRRGAAMVRIDEGVWFKLGCRDTGLLLVLTRTAPEPDGLPGWRTYEELADELGRKSGVPPTRRAVTESVYRIRRALKAADLNPYLLFPDPTTGRVRFLLRPR